MYKQYDDGSVVYDIGVCDIEARLNGWRKDTVRVQQYSTQMPVLGFNTVYVYAMQKAWRILHRSEIELVEIPAFVRS